MIWKTSRREISLEKTLVMAILNVTPDSFSDGGKFLSLGDSLRQAEKLINDGADILDIGGESTRPDSERVSIDEEIKRVVPVIEEISKRFDIPLSIDTSKSEVAEQAVNAGAEIINDISGLRFDEKIAEIAAKHKTGLVLMHLRGEFETIHKQSPVENIFAEISDGFKRSLEKAEEYKIKKERIVLDVGIGFSKTFKQNLELIAKLDKICQEFADYPILVGASRKSFIGKILGDAPTDERIYGTLAANAVAVWNGAKILRVHDVKETSDTIKTVKALKNQR
jgi:dihydropteroate synthase